MSNEVINPDQTFRDDDGNVLANGTITFYVNTTTTLSSIFSDEGLTVAQTNPYTLDAYGRIAGDVKYSGKMTLTMRTESGGFVRTRDNVSTSVDGSTGVKSHATLAAAVADTTLEDGYALNIAERTAGNGGGAMWDVVLSSTVTENTFNIVQCTGVATLSLVLRIDNFIDFVAFGGVADYVTASGLGTDNFAALQAAIDALGGTSDIASNYIYAPAKTLEIPEGDYGFTLGVNDRLNVGVNNIRIIGQGMFNTNLYHMGTAITLEFIRFKEAYACELSNLTIDGGLPFTPAGSETYGIDVPVTLDQVAHFTSHHLNLTNYRLRGIQAIHLWESYFEELRIFNGGFFGDGSNPSAGIAFDDRTKESTTFSGSESNQIKFNKVAFGTVGTLVKMTSPCFNIEFDFVVAEGRTWAVDYGSLSESKWIVDGLSAGIGIDHAWSYHHDQPYNNDASLFDFVNAGPSVNVNNYNIYQEIPAAAPSNYLEVPNIFKNSSAYPINVNISISDVTTAETTLFKSASAGSMVTGRVDYRNDSARTLTDLMGSIGESYYSGEVSFIAGSFTTTTPAVYKWKGKEVTYSQIDGGGFFEEFACRAIANFNGAAAGGARMQKGIVVTRTGVGAYTATFDTLMPDINYAVNFGLQISNLGDAADIGTQGTDKFTFVVRDGAGTLHDSNLIGISVFR